MIYRIREIEQSAADPDTIIVGLDFWDVDTTSAAVGPPHHVDSLTIAGWPTVGQPTRNATGMLVTRSGKLVSPWVLRDGVWANEIPAEDPSDPFVRDELPPFADVVEFHANRLAEQAKAEGRRGDHTDTKLRRAKNRQGHAADARARALIGKKTMQQKGRRHP